MSHFILTSDTVTAGINKINNQLTGGTLTGMEIWTGYTGTVHSNAVKIDYSFPNTMSSTSGGNTIASVSTTVSTNAYLASSLGGSGHTLDGTSTLIMGGGDSIFGRDGNHQVDTSAMFGGSGNTIHGFENSAILGGTGNTMTVGVGLSISTAKLQKLSFIGGGLRNIIRDNISQSWIGGGMGNLIDGAISNSSLQLYNYIAGGSGNTINQTSASGVRGFNAILGGRDCSISNIKNATILGSQVSVLSDEPSDFTFVNRLHHKGLITSNGFKKFVYTDFNDLLPVTTNNVEDDTVGYTPIGNYSMIHIVHNAIGRFGGGIGIVRIDLPEGVKDGHMLFILADPYTAGGAYRRVEVTSGGTTTAKIARDYSITYQEPGSGIGRPGLSMWVYNTVGPTTKAWTRVDDWGSG